MYDYILCLGCLTGDITVHELIVLTLTIPHLISASRVLFVLNFGVKISMQNSVNS